MAEDSTHACDAPTPQWADHVSVQRSAFRAKLSAAEQSHAYKRGSSARVGACSSTGITHLQRSYRSYRSQQHARSIGLHCCCCKQCNTTSPAVPLSSALPLMSLMMRWLV